MGKKNDNILNDTPLKEIRNKKILLAGFRGFGNMGDELIILGNIKTLQGKGNKLYVVAQYPEQLKKFLEQFINTNDIVFIGELPGGFRSFFHYLFFGKWSEIRYFFQIDLVLLGGGEMFTEEMPHSYYYWIKSIWPALLCGKDLILTGGIQPPKKWYNKILFKWILKYTTQILSRDFDELIPLKDFGAQNVSFAMDTSYFSLSNRKQFKYIADQKYIVINLNKRGKHFLNDLYKESEYYLRLGYDIYFVPVCSHQADDDTKFFYQLSKKLNSDRVYLLPRIDDFDKFLHILGGAEKVLTGRLHLFLISEFIGLETKIYPYQKKLLKMKKVIEYFQDQL